VLVLLSRKLSLDLVTLAQLVRKEVAATKDADIPAQITILLALKFLIFIFYLFVCLNYYLAQNNVVHWKCNGFSIFTVKSLSA
jgi:hypothetical protein